jgi:hypothetical protein
MKLEVYADGLIFSDVFSGIGIRTPMGLFGFAQRDGGIEVVWTDPRTGKTNLVFAANGLSEAPEFATYGELKPRLALKKEDEANFLYPVPERVPAYIDGPRAGKGARTITGTISRAEFLEAYRAYWTLGGRQLVSELMRAGFTFQELEHLLSRPPTSWIEDKLEGVSPQRTDGGEKLLLQEQNTGERPKDRPEGGT